MERTSKGSDLLKEKLGYGAFNSVKSMYKYYNAHQPYSHLHFYLSMRAQSMMWQGVPR